jgi:hypothetical protein
MFVQPRLCLRHARNNAGLFKPKKANALKDLEFVHQSPSLQLYSKDSALHILLCYRVKMCIIVGLTLKPVLLFIANVP